MKYIFYFDSFINERNWTEESVRNLLDNETFKNLSELQRKKGGSIVKFLKKPEHIHILNDYFTIRGYNSWNDDTVTELAQKLKDEGKGRNDLHDYKKRAWEYAVKHKILDKVFGERVLWDSEEKVRNEAAKYDTKTDFNKYARGAYEMARTKYKILNELDWLIDDETDNRPRYVYAYIDEENKVAYVGLTVNIQQRDKTHRTGTFCGKPSKSAVYTYFNSIDKDVPEPKVLAQNLSKEEAQRKENENYVEFSKTYTMLNIAKTGVGVGSLGSRKGLQTIQKSLCNAAKCVDVEDFISKYPEDYEYLEKKKMTSKLDDIYNK